MTGSTSLLLDLYGLGAIIALVPVLWAMIDVLRRPTVTLSGWRKVLWMVSLGLVWFIFWPLALFNAIFYLFVMRKRFAPVAPGLSNATWDPYGARPVDRPPDLPPAGWFPDPSGRPGQRWWDGRGWTELTRDGPEHGAPNHAAGGVAPHTGPPQV
jgi:Protein of unknown function (DUF2510)